MLTIVESKESVQFMDLNIGDTFIYANLHFIKIAPITSQDGYTFTAVGLEDGAMQTIKASTTVHPFDADLIIK